MNLIALENRPEDLFGTVLITNNAASPSLR